MRMINGKLRRMPSKGIMLSYLHRRFKLNSNALLRKVEGILTGIRLLFKLGWGSSLARFDCSQGALFGCC